MKHSELIELNDDDLLLDTIFIRQIGRNIAGVIITGLPYHVQEDTTGASHADLLQPDDQQLLTADKMYTTI